jgi:hypothetical protein
MNYLKNLKNLSLILSILLQWIILANYIITMNYLKSLSLILLKIILEQILLILQSKSRLSRHLSLENQKVNIQKKV